MSVYNSEYSGPSVKSSGCAYNTLGSYYNGNSNMAPVPASTISGVYVTPDYSAIGYDTLTHDQGPSCNKYFNIQSAYGNGAGSCNTTYTTRLCSGGRAPNANNRR